MKSLVFITICLVLSQTIHTQFLLNKPDVLQAQVTCTQSIQAAYSQIEAIVKNITTGKLDTITQDLSSLVELGKQAWAVCTAHTIYSSSFATDKCTTDINSILVAIPTIIDHVKSKNILALLSDFSSQKALQTDFNTHCMNQSAECKAKIVTIGTNANATFSDLHAKDQVKVKADVSSLIDQVFAYKTNCIGLQNSLEYLKMISNIFVENSPTVFKMLAVGSDPCMADIDTIFARVPSVVDHLKNYNILSLIGDYSAISGVVTDFSANCVNKSAACQAALADVGAGAKTFGGDFIKGDQAATHTDADNLVDKAFGYEKSCLGPQIFRILMN